MRAQTGRILAILTVAASIAGTAATPALADSRGQFATSCQRQMQMSAAQCGCVADHAMAELDATEREYLMLPATDYPSANALLKKMSSGQIAAIDAFMRKVPDLCRASH